MNLKKRKHLAKLQLSYFVSFCLFFCFYHGFSQQNTRDSLYEEISQFKAENNSYYIKEAYIDLINELALQYRYINQDSLFLLSKKADSLSTLISYKTGKFKAAFNLAEYFSLKGNSIKAVKYYQEILPIAIAKKDAYMEATLINALGSEYLIQRNYEKAHKLFLKGIDLTQAYKDHQMMSIIYENMAQMYIDQKQYHEALALYNKVKDVNEIINDKFTNAQTLTNLADLKTKMGDYDMAMFDVNSSISYLENTDYTDWLAFAYVVKGNIYLHKNKFKWALYWFDQAELLLSNLDDERSKNALLLGKSSCFLGLAEYEKARIYAEEGIMLSKKLMETIKEQKFANLLYKINKVEEQPEAALAYHELFQQLTDSLHKDESEKSLALLRTKMIHEKDRQLLIAQNEKALTKQRNIVYASIIILIILLATAIPLYLNQKKLKKLYKELQKNTQDLRGREMELHRINGAKDRLFSIIGHDLRGPIGALQGLLKLMSNGEMSKDDFLQFVPKIRNDVDYILFTLNNLLSWGYAQMNGIIAKPKNVRLNTLVVTNINLLSEMAEQKKIKIINQLPEECLILADNNQIDVVIRNLISNAIKFTQNHGLITLEAEEIGHYWKIKVKDTGVGMNETTKNNLFKNNSNISTYGTNNEKGTGLGLSLCKEMVEKNSGQIWVESTLQKGSTFFFTLPKATKSYRKAS